MRNLLITLNIVQFGTIIGLLKQIKSYDEFFKKCRNIMNDSPY